MSGQKWHEGESMFFFFHFMKQTIGTKNIVYYLILVNGQFTSFVTQKGSEYNLQHCDGSKPPLMSFLFSVNGTRFVRLIAIYILP